MEKELESYKGLPLNSFGHSNYRIGELEHFHQACYSQITYAQNDRYDQWVIEAGDKPTVCLIMHPDQVNHRYLSYLLNESLWKDVFITKDLAEGFEHGFAIDFHQPYRVRNTGLQAFRVPTEFKTVKLIDELWEYDPDLSFQQILLMVGNFSLVTDGEYRWHNQNYNHTPYSPHSISLSNYLNGKFANVDTATAAYSIWGLSDLVDLNVVWKEFVRDIPPNKSEYKDIFGGVKTLSSYSVPTICEFANFLKGKYT